jgi:hypothetical protein
MGMTAQRETLTLCAPQNEPDSTLSTMSRPCLWRRRRTKFPALSRRNSEQSGRFEKTHHVVDKPSLCQDS